jgi:hypothetical protein
MSESSLKQLGHHTAQYTATEKDAIGDLYDAFANSPLPLAQRLQTFPRHVRRQDIARFLTKYELFKLSLPANGSVIECGVFAGGGLMSWSHFSAILEPYNHTRRVIGFDTFKGFPGMHEKDVQRGTSEHLHEGAFHTSDSIVDEIQLLAAIHDRNRPLGHVPKIELVAGDACQTIPKYVEEHGHLLISLLYLDFDIYAPTRVALEQLYPRVVKGGIVAFDELNCAEFPGETIALLETCDLTQVRLRRFQFDPYISYFVKGE